MQLYGSLIALVVVLVVVVVTNQFVIHANFALVFRITKLSDQFPSTEITRMIASGNACVVVVALCIGNRRWCGCGSRFVKQLADQLIVFIFIFLGALESACSIRCANKRTYADNFTKVCGLLEMYVWGCVCVVNCRKLQKCFCFRLKCEFDEFY